MHSQRIPCQAGDEGRSRKQGQPQARPGDIDALFKGHEDAAPVIDSAFDEKGNHTNKADDGDLALRPYEVRPFLSRLAFIVQVRPEKENAGHDDSRTGKGYALPGQVELEQKGKEGGAHEIAQRPHGLQARHDARTNFSFDKDAIDIDDDIHEA